MLDLHAARHGFGLRVAAVVAASPLPRDGSSNITLSDPNPAAGPAWGPPGGVLLTFALSCCCAFCLLSLLCTDLRSTCNALAMQAQAVEPVLQAFVPSCMIHM